MIRNIILDMGGVVFDIDVHNAGNRFKEIGYKDASTSIGLYGQTGIFLDLEKGKISAEEFLSLFAGMLGKDSVSPEDNQYAWLGYVTEIPKSRIEFLDNLKKNYKLFLLSNTNPFIWEYVDSPAYLEDGRPISAFFDKVFCSYKIHCYKPEPAMFEYLLRDTGIDPIETVFVDDSPKNVSVAASFGMKTILAPAEGGWEELLSELLAEDAKTNSPVYREDELCFIPDKGPCVVLSNHPYGNVDRLVLTQMLADVRPDIRFAEDKDISDLSFTNGELIVLFTDGSTLADGVFEFLKKTKTDIIPVYIEEKPKDYVGSVQIRLSASIKPAEYDSYISPEQLRAYLRNRIYALEGLVHKDNHPVIPNNSYSPVEPHVDPSVIARELSGLKESIFFRENDYTCYLNRYEEIPNIIREIGVCREETFRLNGEGTGKPIDLDEYDKYYLHLHLWNDKCNELVGAYRIGVGSTIMKTKGLHGFYSDLFFHFNDSFSQTLEESLELGRAFIVNKYQVVPNALKMLLNYGIGRLSSRFPNARHFLGTASFSSDIPLLFSSIMVEYFKRTSLNRELCNGIIPDIPFNQDFMRVDVDALNLESLTVEQLDKLIRRLSGGKFRVPTLVRAYVKHNCRFIGFNIDPDFNYSLDGLIISDLNFYE